MLIIGLVLVLPLLDFFKYPPLGSWSVLVEDALAVAHLAGTITPWPHGPASSTGRQSASLDRLGARGSHLPLAGSEGHIQRMLWRFRAKFSHVLMSIHRKMSRELFRSKVIEDMRQFYNVLASEYHLVP